MCCIVPQDSVKHYHFSAKQVDCLFPFWMNGYLNRSIFVIAYS